MKDFAGRVAAITGAGSGIGRALAVDLSKRGCHLALADVDEEGLAETVTKCEGRGVKVTSRRLDVADRDDVFAWADEVVAEHGAVHLVVNNAGVALVATVEHMSYDDLEWLMGVNFWGVVHGTKAFLPHLKQADQGHIVNLSSVFGLVSIPTQSAYNAAKFAVRGFTEALYQEMKINKHPVAVTTVHPGGIKTAIARNATASGEVDSNELAKLFDKRLANTTPERAATIILEAVRKKKPRVLVGADAKVLDFIVRMTGSGYLDAFSGVTSRLMPSKG